MKLCVGCVLLIALLGPCVCEDKLLPVVINTWPFVDANKGGIIIIIIIITLISSEYTELGATSPHVPRTVIY